MTVMSWTLKSVMSIALGATIAIGGASAQEKTEEAAAKKPANNPWLKICEVNKDTKKEICVMNIQVLSPEQKPIAQVRIVEQKGAAKKLLSIIMPPGLLIQPGMRIQVDKTNIGTAKFQVCTPQACIAETTLGSKFIGSLKRGNEMNIVGIDQARKQAGFKVTLSGFTAAYDGDPIDPKELQEKTETLQQKLQRKADEARQRLLEEKKKEEAASE
ncbi:MAG: invasion associated locus B family protein [Hyphomicrobiales bacterium]